MKKYLFPLVACLGLGFAASPAFSADANDDVVERISKKLLERNIRVTDVYPSKVPGVFEVLTSDSKAYYVSDDGKYIFLGDLYNLDTMENLSEAVFNGPRSELLKTLDASSTIAFKPEGESKYVLNVFTDIDCGYCRKLHREMEEYNALGIEMRYIAYPRAGIDSDSYNKAVDVWCADDKMDAMTTAKEGYKVRSKKCDDHPVKEHHALAKKMGLSGTPSIVLENGALIPGYMPPRRLLLELEKMK